MRAKHLLLAAESVYRTNGLYGITVWVGTDVSVEELACSVPPDKLPHPDIRVAQVEAIRAAGFEVIWTGPRPHATLVVPEPHDAGWCNTLDVVFGTPRINPNVGPR
jgi:hypothetical protein